jgi:phage portal protein BeeE
LLPILTQYEAEMACKLFIPDEIEKGFFFYYNVDVILRANIEARANAYATMISNGVLTINEARNKENLARVDGGDTTLVQGATTTLDNVIKGLNFKGGEKNNAT